MTWCLLAVTAVGFIWFLAIGFGFVPPPNARTLIRIHQGQLQITRGQLRAQPREFVSHILQQTRIASGYIAITHYNRVAFSRNIPANIRQRLRNVLLNPP